MRYLILVEFEVQADTEEEATKTFYDTLASNPHTHEMWPTIISTMAWSDELEAYHG